MAGHSKWANIKHRKGAQDAKKAKAFTRIVKEISVCVKTGGADPASNPRLRTAIANAKSFNIPKENLTRAIKKASGADATDYQEVTFEGYAPGGVGIFLECTTDNMNRTVSNVRAIFNKFGGSLGKNGSLEFIFDRKAVFVLDKSQEILPPLDELEMMLIDYGMDELERAENWLIIYTHFENFGKMQQQLEQMQIEIHRSELERVPNNTVALDAQMAQKVYKMIDRFEEDEDVQNVYHNLEENQT